MNTRNAPNSGIAVYVLIAFGLAWISLMIRWGMFRTALLAAICAWILLSGQHKTGKKKGVNHGLGYSNT